VNTLQTALELCGVFLNIVLLFLLLRGFLPKYSILFAYNLAEFLITLIERVLFQEAQRGTETYAHVYWTAEVIWDFLLFLLVTVLIHRALAGRPEREMARKILLIVLVAVLVLPFVLFHDRAVFSSRWFSGASQLLNFGAAVLTLVLWGALIASRNRDSQLMMVCAGLGMTVAGAAFAWGIRQLAVGRNFTAENIRNVADLFAGLTYVLGLAIWCWAFRTSPQASPAPTAPVT
jgi:hypothetical protein